jgi:hypothetical protein
MSGLVRTLRFGAFGGIGGLVSIGGQQVARRNAATAAASMLRRRQEREDVDAYLAGRLELAQRRDPAQRLDAPVGARARAGTAS